MDFTDISEVPSLSPPSPLSQKVRTQCLALGSQKSFLSGMKQQYRNCLMDEKQV